LRTYKSSECLLLILVFLKEVFVNQLKSEVFLKTTEKNPVSSVTPQGADEIVRLYREGILKD